MKNVLITILFTTILLLSRLAAGQAASVCLDGQLIAAAKSGDTAQVQQLLDKGANIEARNSDGFPALIIAIQEDKADVVRLLLDKGANIEAADKYGDTALIAAASSNHTGIVKLLLEKNANIEAEDIRNRTALINAAYGSESIAVKLLLDRGANLEVKDDDGYTALIYAAQMSSNETVRVLLDKGANIEATNKGGLTALLSAAGAYMGGADTVKLLLDQHANIEAKSGNGDTALLIAAMKGKVDVVKLLLDRSANVEAKENDGRTALIGAALNGKTDVVKLLLDSGANIEAKDNNGHTALFSVAESGHVEMVNLLLEKGADLEPTDRDTLLIDAAGNGRIEIVKLMLDEGANIDARNPKISLDGSDTALFNAVEHLRTEVVKLLLERGANLEAKNNAGQTALNWADEMRQGEEGVVKRFPNNSFNADQLSTTTEIESLLKQAVLHNPRNLFDEAFNDFQRRSLDDDLREKVIRATADFPTPPAIPDDAKQLFQQATAMLKNIQGNPASTPDDLQKPIELLTKALAIAPWWGNAYYNLSRAQELNSQYDQAIKQLNYYIELKPSDADAADARNKIAVIQSEKDNAAQKQQQNESLLAVKYVSGGIGRVRYSEAPSWWHDSGRIDTLYTYLVPEEKPLYANVFRMPNGYLLTISLLALSNNGAYTGDRVAVRAWNVTDGGCGEGFTFAFGEHSYTDACGVHYDVSVSNQNDPNAFVSVTYTPTGAAVTLPLTLLYRGRAWRGNWDGTVYQAGQDKRGEVLHFEPGVVNAARDPGVNAMGLTPITVTPASK